ncbi:hypothetical protein GOBAR_AA03413 [Gossypium barbadense]|uniref:Myb/SANT-like domain-containing protein n=1 Tax=Gossypium barbadense TaxID=3634 RepID=A0A2P5YNL6_GOSBA|nr:hypothetical protein GOBAR_AA03413 [Gossypium barbadense]
MGKGNKEGTSKQFRWTKPMEHIFLEILAEEAQKGNKPSNTFKTVSIKRVVEAISERATYDAAVMAHKKYEPFLNKSIDHYDEMALVVGKDMAIGSFARTFADIDLDDGNQDSVPLDCYNEEDEEGRTNVSSSGTSKHKTPQLYEQVMSMEEEGFHDDFLCSVFDYLISKMYTSRKKIHKDKDAEPTEFEESIAQAFFDLENTNQDLKSDLKDLYINSAVQIDVSGSRKAVVIHVPYRLRKAFRKVHVKLVRELEKKFSGKDVILIATRRILRPPKKGSAVQRPRSRTLTAVHEAMLEDVVLPAEIVGKRTRYRIDGSKIMKVYLDPKERNNTEYKLETFSAVYRKLAGKDVVFEFPVTEA